MRLRRNRLARDRSGGFFAQELLLAWLLLTGAGPLFAAPHTPCVNNVSDFRTELQKAGTGGINNDTDTHINLAVGVYPTDGTVFQYGSTKTFTLDITGGYNSDCSKVLTQNPIYTVLSGVGSSTPIVQSNSMGDVSIRFLTFNGGHVSGNGSALGMNFGSSTGQIILDYDIFSGNSGGAVVYIGGSSLVQLDGSLFYENVTTQETFYMTNTGQFYAINNTFAQNTIAESGPCASVLVGFIHSAALSNNIFFNNTLTNTGSQGCAAFNVELIGDTGSTVQLENNIANPVSVSSTTLTDNDFPGSPDPQFASSTDFHLMPTSPGIAAGTLTPSGGLPQLDIQGNPRTFNGSVDLGAYERGDDIFRDGFGF